MKSVNTGLGIPAAERERVFDRYFQGLSTSLRDHGGSGIGLSFVKEIVSLHNGRVWMEEARPHGSSFVISLPLSQDVEITGEHRVSDLDIRVEPVKGSAQVPYPDSEPAHLRIEWPSLLVTEDNPEVAQVVVHTLEDLYNVYFAKDGMEGLEHLKARKIDCIVSDIMMPRMDGRSFLRGVKKDERWKVIPFVCLTSMSDMEIMVECLKLGANNYVTKPFHREVLRSTVETLIQNSRFRDQLVAKDKMASLGLLSAGLAHGIRNPVHSAQNLLGSLGREFERWGRVDFSDSKQVESELRRLSEHASLMKDSFTDARNCVVRINELVDAIGIYSTGSTEIVTLNLASLVSQVFKMLGGKIREKRVTVKHTGGDGVTVECFPTLFQAVMNVVDNAVDAVPEDSGSVDIFIEDRGDVAQIRVVDNGSGVPLRLQPHIFEAFLTTKSAGGGMGLGLYIAKRIVEYHRGSIEVRSEQGRGATFLITLMRCPQLEKRDVLDFKGFPVSF